MLHQGPESSVPVKLRHCYPRHEPGRYFGGSPLAAAGAHLKPPTCTLPAPEYVRAAPAESVGVSVSALLAAAPSDVEADVVTLMTPLALVATVATYCVVVVPSPQPQLFAPIELDVDVW